MSIDAREKYLKKNKHIKQVMTAPAIISGIAGVTHKVDGGFNDLLGRIGSANPHTPLGESHGDKGIKAVKTREAVKRQKARQG